MPKFESSKYYLIGGGIASLSAAVYLINDGKVNPKNISIFEAKKKLGGSLDAKDSSSKKGYIMRGIRMFEEKAFSSTFNLMSQIPSIQNPQMNLREEFIDFNKKHKTYCDKRLLKNGKVIKSKAFGISYKDKIKLIALLFRREKSLDNLKIEDYFSSGFFKTTFWYEFCTIFAFQSWHSLIEFRRYIFRFIHTLDYFDTLEPVEITPYNQYESMILPTKHWLKKQGINFINDTKITNLNFDEINDKKSVSKIHYKTDIKKGEIKVGEKDFVFVTIGSMVANSSNGSMNKSPTLNDNKKDIAWSLWENISKNNPDFGNPKVFNSSINKSQWIAFTITFNNHTFFKLMKEFVNKKDTAHGGVTLTDSNWFISVVLFHEPYFLEQTKEEKLCWGYSLFSDKKGNYIKKKMSECSGEEILTELVYHLGFEKHLDSILKDTVCIPSRTPYITSHFLARKLGDRPKVVPKSSSNLAFLGQFTEIPKDIVFTVEYSVRSAQIAVNTLLKLNKRETPIYNGFYNLKSLFNAFKILIFDKKN